MTLEQQLLLSFLQSENRERWSIPSDVQWELLVREARLQGVFLSLFSIASKYKERIPRDEYKRCFDSGYTTVAANARISIAQKKLIEILDDSDCSYVILKGAASAFYYPKPELRMLGDVDFLIREEDKEKITSHLIAEGFAASCEYGSHHCVFSKGTLRFEMHFEVAGIPTDSLGVKVRRFFDDIFLCSEVANDGISKYKKPSDLHHGLILLLHMQHHMQDVGMGLRHLSDWSWFVQKTSACAFWEETFLPFLEEIGLCHYASVMTKTCSLYLGTVCPSWADGVQEALCEDVIEDILASGNFGRKDILRRTSAVLIPQNEEGKKAKSKSHALYLTMKRSVLAHHPQSIDNKFVYGWFFIYRTLRYTWMVLSRKRISALQSVGRAKQRMELYNKLRIFEVEEE